MFYLLSEPSSDGQKWLVGAGTMPTIASAKRPRSRSLQALSVGLSACRHRSGVGIGRARPISAELDEVGYIPFDPQAANLMFALVSSRYERASMIVTSNKPFSKAHRFE
jgi:hypothetical protein